MSNYQQQPHNPQQPFTPDHLSSQPSQPKQKHTLRTVLIVGASVFAVLFAVVVLIVAVALAPSGPAKQTEGTAPAVTESSAPAPTETTPPAVEETTAPPTPEGSGIAKVGAKQWFTYQDGVQVQVTKLARFKISSTAAGGKPGDVGVIATVTIKNGTAETFDASMAQVTLAAGPNGDEADTVYDSEQNVGGGFEGSIPKGRSKTAKVGFAVSKAQLSKLVVEVTPSWDHEASFFEGSVK